MNSIWVGGIMSDAEYERRSRDNIKYYIIYEKHNDFNLPNEAMMTEIDISTLEECGEVEV